ncbi:MAG: FAD-dependent thymidylate synthase [Myxococcota bacterium]
MALLSPATPPKVSLVQVPEQPFNTAIAAARTCYSSRVITAQDVTATEQSRAQRDSIAQSTFEAGHHTVFQHASFTFVLEQVSRQVIWSLLHAHPFYNSEQVSQRYVEVKAGRYHVPALSDEARALYVQTVDEMHTTYKSLVEALTPTAAEAYFGVFPSRKRHAEKYGKDIKKKAQEIARYALPVATHAHLYHSITSLTLFRYWRLCQQLDVPDEARALIETMVAQVRALDVDLFKNVQDPMPLEDTLEFRVLKDLGVDPHGGGNGGAFCREFDEDLQGRTSRLWGYGADAERAVAQAVRDTLGLTRGQLDDDNAIERVLDPARNPYLGERLNLGTVAKLTRALNHASYTFRKKLSHTADSQDQRHRMTPASRPVLARQVDLGRVDVVIPPLLAQTPAGVERFHACMEKVWSAMRQLAETRVPAESWSYLLPNAFPVRFMETGDLLHHHHKWTTRLCFTAQEEIWRACVDEVEQVQQVHPRLGKWLLPPCGLRHRAETTPYCPEGSRYCGVPVWRKQMSEYLRVI